MTLYVLISTLGEGIRAVPSVLLPAEEAVRYIVVWQSEGQPLTACPFELSERSDVHVEIQEGRGLCRSRNAAIAAAIAQMEDPLEDAVFLITDDDVCLREDAFNRIRELYERYPKLDVALFGINNSVTGEPLKRYPARLTSYAHRPRCYYPSSVEMTMRSRVAQIGLRFDERFGLGSEQLCACEESVFMTEVIRRKLTALIVPTIIGSTDPKTTGQQALNVKTLRSKGALYGYQLSLPLAWLRSLKEALSLAVRKDISPFGLLREIWWGVQYIRK